MIKRMILMKGYKEFPTKCLNVGCTEQHSVKIPDPQTMIWQDTGKKVKLWELMPCEDFSKYTREEIDRYLKALYGVGL